MHTNRLFRENVYLRECDASIRSVSTREGKVLITLDQTIFFPTGGGQRCDLGTINDFAVVDVYEYEDDIFHCVACAPDALRVGDSVHLTLDWARRFDNMQRHCGEHILSGTLHRLFGAENVGFHIGTPYVRMDTSIPLTAAQLAEAEAEEKQIPLEKKPVSIAIDEVYTGKLKIKK